MKHITVDNGMTVHLMQTRKFKTNTITVLLRNGLHRETAAKNSLLAGILDMGCERFKSKREIALECEEMFGAAYEMSVIKKGEEQIIQLYIEVLRDSFCGQDLSQQAGRLLNCLLYRPLEDNGKFREDYTKIQKHLLAERIKSKINDKKRYALERCVELMCREERFGVPCEGYLEDVSGLDSCNMYSHYKNALATRVLDIGVIGDYDEESCVNWAVKHLKTESKPQPLNIGVSPVEEKKPQEIKEHMGLSQGKLVVGIRYGSGVKGREFYKLLLLNEIIGGGANSMLFKEAREKRSLCYYINSFIYRAKSIMIIQGGVDEERLEETVEIIKEQLRLITGGQLKEQDLDLAKLSLKNQFAIIKDSPQRIMDFYLSGAIVGDYTEIGDAIDIIDSFTIDDIKGCANKALLDTIYFLK